MQQNPPDKPIVEKNDPDQPIAAKRSWKAWLKKVGIAGFLFFLIKGLLWLVAGYLIFK